jgi:hypothetical protein
MFAKSIGQPERACHCACVGGHGKSARARVCVRVRARVRVHARALVRALVRTRVRGCVCVRGARARVGARLGVRVRVRVRVPVCARASEGCKRELNATHGSVVPHSTWKQASTCRSMNWRVHSPRTSTAKFFNTPASVAQRFEEGFEGSTVLAMSEQQVTAYCAQFAIDVANQLDGKCLHQLWLWRTLTGYLDFLKDPNFKCGFEFGLTLHMSTTRDLLACCHACAEPVVQRLNPHAATFQQGCFAGVGVVVGPAGRGS